MQVHHCADSPGTCLYVKIFLHFSLTYLAFDCRILIKTGDKGSQLDALREVAAAAAARHRRTPSYEDDQEEVRLP
jgi:hypothetical protein